VDAEYQAFLERSAQEALEDARERLPTGVPSTLLVHRARSAPAALLEVAEQRDATAIVLGSSAAGVLGQVTLGSVSDRLLHSSHVPLALTPRGYRCRAISAWRA
jgi:nucleotide-binding universal stress UspA family protein